MQNYSIGRNWILNKCTKYHFQGLSIYVEIDSSPKITLAFDVFEIYIYSECCDRIFEIAKNPPKSYLTNLSSIHQVNFCMYGCKNESIHGKTWSLITYILHSKGFWITFSVMFLLVAIIVAIKLGGLQKITKYESIKERWLARSRR
ncbi:hypothetical protein RF11_00778 [Thelohanellus kitauei]|uniref:Uncharacterized protein n=1 Tax=Thelohanellus kitauei TaxID=669202 RepID=A0A0C2J296_THEKT|nr:hypothetical protein RF11_00778 [Thelohanellus kitauei]